MSLGGDGEEWQVRGYKGRYPALTDDAICWPHVSPRGPAHSLRQAQMQQGEEVSRQSALHMQDCITILGFVNWA